MRDFDEQVWKLVTELGKEERHFNQVQHQYRLLASTWLLAMFAGVGFALSKQDLSIPAELIVSVLGLAGAIGITQLWNLDIRVYHQLLDSCFVQSLKLEREYPWLPQLRSSILSTQTQGLSASAKETSQQRPSPSPTGVLARPVLYLAVFTVLLGIVWSRLDDKSVIAITSVLAGRLDGLIGAFLFSVISHRRSEQESEDRLKQYASTQALELTKLAFDLRRETKRQNQLLAPAKAYREFYKALFELYKTRSWPKDIEELGLLNILQYENINRSDTSDKPFNPTSAGGGQQ